MSEQVRCRESFWIAGVSKGRNKRPERYVRRGDLVDANDPAVKNNPHRFESPDTPAHPELSFGPDTGTVEAATANPGERR